jgi:hypothetical protein
MKAAYSRGVRADKVFSNYSPSKVLSSEGRVEEL